MQKLKKTRRKHKQTERNRHKTEKQLEGKLKTNRNTGYPAHEPPRINRTNYSRRFVGWISCISGFCFMFSFEFFCFVYVYFCLFRFSPSLFKLLQLQSKKTHIKTTKNRTTRRNPETQKKKQKSPS